MSKEREVLDGFAALLITARDEAIEEITDDSTGKGINITRSASMLQSYNLDIRIINFIIDHFMFKLLFQIQDAKIEHDIEICARYEDRDYVLNNISDGLAGEFLTKDGYIARISKYPVGNEG